MRPKVHGETLEINCFSCIVIPVALGKIASGSNNKQIVKSNENWKKKCNSVLEVLVCLFSYDWLIMPITFSRKSTKIVEFVVQNVSLSDAQFSKSQNLKLCFTRSISLEIFTRTFYYWLLMDQVSWVFLTYYCYYHLKLPWKIGVFLTQSSSQVSPCWKINPELLRVMTSNFDQTLKGFL